MTSRTSRTTPNPHDNRDNGALSKFDISSNEILSEGLIAIAEVLNTTAITDLNIAGNNIAYNSEWDKSEDGINKLATVLEDNGAMSILDVSNNRIGAEGAKALAPAM